MHQATVIRRNPAICFSKMGEEFLALDAEAGFCYSLNLVSGRIWDLIEQPVTFDWICAQLLQEYAVDEETCRRDVDEVLTGLAQAGLVAIDDSKTDS